MKREVFNPADSFRVQYGLDWDDEIIIDLFAGGGGASTGLEIGLKRTVFAAVNHNPKAIAMHEANHPHTKHYVQDVFAVDPLEMTEGRKVGWMHASPDCFPAGTMILTSTGYLPIETIEVGMRVLTHQGRWRRVTTILTTQKKLMGIVGYGHPGALQVSSEHPFWTKARINVWDNNIRQYKPKFSDAHWTNASALVAVSQSGGGHYWATPAAIETLPVIQMEDAPTGGTSLPFDERLLWLAGHYVGNGWSRLTETRGELVIITGKHKAAEIRQQLDQWPRTGVRVANGELSWNSRETRTSIQFTANSRTLVAWLREQFGHLAQNKQIPAWLYGQNESLRRAFLQGYMAADGNLTQDHRGFDVSSAQTVSKALAFGLKTLLCGLGYSPAMYFRPTHQNADVIEGRKVNIRDSYVIRWRENLTGERNQTLIAENQFWAPIRTIKPETDELSTVYNFSVEEDESYVANGITVHNCTHHSQAAGGQPRKKEIRDLPWVILKFAGIVRPRIISMENVQQMLHWCPLIARRDKATGRIITLDIIVDPVTKKKTNRVAEPGEVVPVQNQFLIPNPKIKGKTWNHFKRSLEKLGYKVEWHLMRGCDYGAPTIRKRLFMIARCDGKPIVWPEATHHKKPKKTQGKLPQSAQIIDFTDLGASIFERQKPLATATMNRIAKGLKKFVIDSDNPFIVTTDSTNATFIKRDFGNSVGHAITEPSDTITANGGGHSSLLTGRLAPFIGRDFRTTIGHTCDEPLATTTASFNGHSSLISPVMVPYLAGTGGPKYSAKPTAIDQPLGTLCATNHKAIFTPVLVPYLTEFANASSQRNWAINQPLSTICAQVKGGHHGLVTPVLIQTGFGERKGQAPRALDITQPLGTIVGTGKHALAAPVLIHAGHGEGTADKPRWSHGCNSITEPLGTVTASGGGRALAASMLVKFRHDSEGHSLHEPMPTITAGGNAKRPAGAPHALGLASSIMVQANGGFNQTAAHDLREPMSTITNKGSQQQLTSAVFTQAYYGDKRPSDHRAGTLEDPLRTISTENRHSLITATLSKEDLEGALRVAAFLINFYGNGDARDITQPADTLTTKDRLALVTVYIKGDPYVIVDIRMRMLKPRELYRAQGFPDTYIIDRGADGKPLTKSEQVHMCGNSVCPPPMAALAAANYY